MENERRSKIIVITVIVLLLLVLGGAVFAIYNLYFGETSVSEFRSETTEATQVAQTTDKKNRRPVNPIDFTSLWKKNSEIVAWITVPDTKIDYPILQSEKRDDFYIHHDVNGNYKYAGSIYMEYCNSSEMSDRVTVLYGHNMIDGSMFANLHKFENSDFFKKHRYFYIYTNERKLTYEVVSGYNYDNRHLMNSFNFAQDEIFSDYLKYIQNPRSTVRNVRSKLSHKLSLDDKIVTLSTCLNSGDGRYLLQGVLVKDELTR